jgi:hypothetical protein
MHSFKVQPQNLSDSRFTFLKCVEGARRYVCI